MRRRSWSSELLILACAAALPACRGREAPVDAGSATPSASVPVDAAPSTASAPRDAGAPDGSAPGGRADARPAADGPDFAGGECPSFHPDHWTGYDPFPSEAPCLLFTPASPVSKDTLPVIAWEPCGREGFGPRCRRVKTARGERLSFTEGDARRVDVQGQGPGRIVVSLTCDRFDRRVYLASDLDGPVTGALELVPVPGWCGLDPPSLRASGWGVDVRIPFDEDHQAPVPASLTAARGQWVPTKHDEWLPSEYSAELKALANWTTASRTKADARAMRTAGLKKPRVSVGSDRTDVVWSVWEDAPAPSVTCHVFTGRWVETPEDVVATHLIDLPCVEAAGFWKVRCGFAATVTGEGQTLLLRLSDGMAYRFPKLGAALDESRVAQTAPLDLSCKELFLAVGGASPNVFRIPLDALPAGTPPPEPPRLLASTRDLDGGAGARDGGWLVEP